jgi:hypothetical protein
VAREFGIARKTVNKMLRYSAPPGYQRQQPIRRPKLGPWLGVIEAILEDDQHQPKKQRHTAKRIFDRLRTEHGYSGGYTIVKDCGNRPFPVRRHRHSIDITRVPFQGAQQARSWRIQRGMQLAQPRSGCALRYSSRETRNRRPFAIRHQPSDYLRGELTWIARNHMRREPGSAVYQFECFLVWILRTHIIELQWVLLTPLGHLCA